MANKEIIMPDSELESRYERYKGVIKNLTLMSDIASGRIAEVRRRSMSCNCMTRTSQQECRGILELCEMYLKK